MPQDRFSSEAVTDRLAKLLTNPAALTRAAKAAKSSGRANAAERLADMVLDMLGLNPAGSPDNKNMTQDRGDMQ